MVLFFVQECNIEPEPEIPRAAYDPFDFANVVSYAVFLEEY